MYRNILALRHKQVSGAFKVGRKDVPLRSVIRILADDHEGSFMPTTSPIFNTDKIYRLLVVQITDYAPFLLTPNGGVEIWNLGPSASRARSLRNL